MHRIVSQDVLGKTEVSQLQFSLVYQDVLRFNVSVNDAVGD